MRLPGLDFVRVLAVYFIILSHAGYETFRGVGVPFLLALSGFLITNSLLREFDRTDNIALRKFWWNRLLRIGPAYFTFVILAFTIDTILSDTWPDLLLLAALTHTVNYHNAFFGHGTSIVAHLWTLSTLEQFYLIYPAILAPALIIRKPMLVIVALIAATIIWRILIYTETVFVEHKIAWIYNSLDTRLDSMLIGCLAAFGMRYLPYEKLNMSNFLWLVLVVSLIYALREIKIIHSFHYTFGFVVEGALAIAIMLGFMKLSEVRLLSFVNGDSVGYLAKISYPMYLYHPIGFGFAWKFFDGKAPVLIVGTVTTVLLATGSYIVIERYFMRMRSTDNALRVFK